MIAALGLVVPHVSAPTSHPVSTCGSSGTRFAKGGGREGAFATRTRSATHSEYRSLPPDADILLAGLLFWEVVVAAPVVAIPDRSDRLDISAWS